MAVEIGPVLSFLSQRIVLAPEQVESPRATARSTPVKRFREGLITEAGFREELRSLGWSAPDIERSLVQAKLERDFDDFQDRLSALEDAYNKDLITFEDLKVQLLTLIPDQAKALIVLDRLDFAKRPKPKPLAPEDPPTLTVGRLLAAFKAGVLPEEGLRAELAERGYSPVDVDIMVATEEARLPKPKTEKRKSLTLGDLRALRALGIISGEELQAELLARNYSAEDAAALTSLENARIVQRFPKPKPEQVARLPLSDLKAMYLAGIISEEELLAEFGARKFSAADSALELDLLKAKLAAAVPKPKEEKPKPIPVLSVGQLLVAFKAGTLTEPDLRSELAERRYSQANITTLIATAIAQLPKPPPERRQQLTLSQLNSLLDLGTINSDEYLDALEARGYTLEDANSILRIQVERQVSRIPKPTPEKRAVLPLGDLKAMFSLGIITEEELRAELLTRKLSAADIEREIALLQIKLSPVLAA